MLTQLSTLKTRLAITVPDYDTILTNAITALSTRFDNETNRTLSRTTSLTYEFDGSDTEIIPPCFPVESVTKFELKTSEAEGWVEQTSVTYLIRKSCIISLQSPLAFTTPNSALSIGRVTYAGGYVLPGTTPGAGQTALPSDIENAVVEQVSYWFTNRDKLGLIGNRPNAGTYEQFAQFDLLPSVAQVIKKYQRWTI